jgi:hypothetical protein
VCRCIREVALQHGDIARLGVCKRRDRICGAEIACRIRGRDDGIFAVRRREYDGEIAGRAGDRHQPAGNRLCRQVLSDHVGAQAFADGSNQAGRQAAARHHDRLVGALAAKIAGPLVAED